MKVLASKLSKPADPDDQMELLGYKKLGEGGEGSVWLDPKRPNTVIKISRVVDKGSTESWLDFCMMHPSPYYVKVYGYEYFKWNSKTYVQARLERLQDITKDQSRTLRKWYNKQRPKDFAAAQYPAKTFEQALLYAVRYGRDKGRFIDIVDQSGGRYMNNVMRRGATLVLTDLWW